jgi:glutamate racemase
VKPAVALSRNGRIGVMATRRTIDSERLRALVAQHAADHTVVLQACPGLVDAIESGRMDEGAMQLLIEPLCAPLRDAGVDTVVLGCTHYPFVAPLIQARMGPGVVLVDTAEAVALRAQQVWSTAAGAIPQQAKRGPDGLGMLCLETTGDALVLTTLARRWLGIDVTATRIVL